MPRRAIVEIRGGPLQGQRTVVPPGGKLRVGRTERADLAVPHDSAMSAVHFELTWDGASCRVRDLGSARGTLLDGAPITEAEAPHGTWLRAGKTDLLVFVEGHPQPPEEDDDNDDDEDEAALAQRAEERAARAAAEERALAALRAEAASARLYAVLDGARSRRILQLLRASVEEHRSLYEGREAVPLAEVAPYLVGPFAADSLLLEALVREGLGERWGIFLSSPRPFRDVRRHLRRFLMVEEEATAERFYFRFYDPHVAQIFLPTTSPRQREDLFDDIDSILAEGAGGALVRFRADGSRDVMEACAAPPC